MAFLTTRIQQEINKGGTYRATFHHNGENNIRRINPLCDCIKYKANHPEYTFWYKTNKTTNKIVVITYTNGDSDFLELQSIVNEN